MNIYSGNRNEVVALAEVLKPRIYK